MDGANAGHFIAESESEVAEPSNRSSVAQKLPPELLIEIFSLTTTPIRTNKLIDNYNAVVFLSQVCKDWRQVAHETPHLWTDLCIIIPDYPSDVIKTWLGHSAQRPLSITLSADGRHSDPGCHKRDTPRKKPPGPPRNHHSSFSFRDGSAFRGAVESPPNLSIDQIREADHGFRGQCRFVCPGTQLA
ncbi:hypothetical protein B0H11DRAFT_1235637 [Mycena galericulata]|nr:hypothetical protein B0H11DRAFT_1235637 [Mycena galericulata]